MVGGDTQRFCEPHPLPQDHLVQRLILDQFHDDERLRVVFSDLVRGDDIGMIQRRGGLGLLNEPSAPVGVGEPGLGEQFDGDEPVEACVYGPCKPGPCRPLRSSFSRAKCPSLVPSMFVPW